MSTGLNLRESVLRAKETLAKGRHKLRQQHDAGSPGVQVSASLTDLFDAVVMDIVESALDDLGEDGPNGLLKEITLVPHGGYGRRDVAPYSDVDLMLLHTPAAHSRAAALAKRLQQDMSDVGLVLGHSLRTPAQAVQLAITDPMIFTSLAENRYLAGSVSLFRKFADQLVKKAKRNYRQIYYGIIEARKEERVQYGEIVYLLEPNVKRSRGSLRGIQMARWIGFAKYGEVEIDALYRLGVMTEKDRRTLRDTKDYLLQIRNELQFHAGKATDLVDRAEQLRMAELYGFEGTEGLLPVEQFMQKYFKKTISVRDTVSHFVESERPRSTMVGMFAPLFTHKVDRDFRVGPIHISTSKQWKERYSGDVSEILRLMDLANLYVRRIDHPTWEAIRTSMQSQPIKVELDDEVRGRFLSLISQPARLGELLRRLHELRVLEKIIPGLKHARCLLQFNQYHKYTVDAHCIECVECLTDFANRDDTLGDVYRSLNDKRILHLAMLIHDLGKGFAEDHSKVGMRYADKLADRLRLSPLEKENVKFLVHKHLVMSHLAFRRDTSDPRVLVQFAVEVGSPDVLKMLYLLTCADFAGVGPGTLNPWKVRVMTDLYRRTMQHLGGDETVESSENRKMKRERLDQLVDPSDDRAEWFQQQFNALPPGYMQTTSAEQIVQELDELQKLPESKVIVWANYKEDRGVLEVTMGSKAQSRPGVFHRLTGAVSSQRFGILSAEINTLAEEMVLDRFLVEDQDHEGAPPEERLKSICREIETALNDTDESPPTFRKVWSSRASQSAEGMNLLPTEVRIDNSTSEQFTIIDLFAHDQLGLLYTVAKTIHDLDLEVCVAKITTHLDQVVDVFYVTDRSGNQVTDGDQLENIRVQLCAAVDEFSAEKLAM
ncbi:MAG: [protein-PII] uridylyltransferase [Pirellulales bacterium]